MTNYNQQYIDLGFKDLENCILYESLDEAIEKFNCVVNNEDQLISIAEEGYKLSHRHTYTKRLEEVLGAV